MKFIYNDKVKVVKGFYKGQSGVVKKTHMVYLRYNPNIIYYTVINGRLKFEDIQEDYLEKV